MMTIFDSFPSSSSLASSFNNAPLSNTTDSSISTSGDEEQDGLTLQQFPTTHQMQRSNSVDSLCSFTTNTTTTISSLSDVQEFALLPSDEDEDEDWLEFGYLLDSKDADQVLPASSVHHHQKHHHHHHHHQRDISKPIPPPAFQGWNSSDLGKGKWETSSLGSSLDVEVSSISSHSSDTIPHFQKKDEGDGNSTTTTAVTSSDSFDDLPVAMRTRSSSLANQPEKQSLHNLNDHTHQEEKTKKASSSAPAPVSLTTPTPLPFHHRKHDVVCRPWWHNKFLASQQEQQAQQREEIVRRQPEPLVASTPAPVTREVVPEICDPRFISLGGSPSSKESPLTAPTATMKKEPTIFLRNSNAPEPKTPDSNAPRTGDESSRGGTPRHSQRVLRMHRSPAESKQQQQQQAPSRTRKRSRNSEGTDSSPSPKKKHNSITAVGAASRNGDREGCPCGAPFTSKKFHLNCSQCQRSYHGKCVGITEKRALKVRDEWICPNCSEQQKKDSDSGDLFCVCRQPYDGRFYVACDNCDAWLHPSCVGITEEEVNAMEQFVCPTCRRRSGNSTTTATNTNTNNRRPTSSSSRR